LPRALLPPAQCLVRAFGVNAGQDHASFALACRRSVSPTPSADEKTMSPKARSPASTANVDAVKIDAREMLARNSVRVIAVADMWGMTLPE